MLSGRSQVQVLLGSPISHANPSRQGQKPLAVFDFQEGAIRAVASQSDPSHDESVT